MHNIVGSPSARCVPASPRVLLDRCVGLAPQIVGPDTRPVTADLRTAIQRAFASTTSLNKFESQVTVTAAQAAPATTIPSAAAAARRPPGPHLHRTHSLDRLQLDVMALPQNIQSCRPLPGPSWCADAAALRS